MTRLFGDAVTRPAGDTGSATVYVLAGCFLVGLGALVPMITAEAARARHTAAVAADAAALAGAQTADVGQLTQATAPAAASLTARGCRRAAAVARSDHAELIACSLRPCAAGATSLQVTVRVLVGWVGLPIPRGSSVVVPARAGGVDCLAKSPP